MTTERITVHPIFDRTGFYRLATEDLVWSDDAGRQTIRDFFQSRRRHGLRESWKTEVPEQPQDWGLGPPVNVAIHEFLKAKSERVRRQQPERESLDVAAAPGASGEEELEPALLILRLEHGDLDLTEDRAPRPTRSPWFLFTGVGEKPGSRSSPTFEVNIPLLALTERHRCLLLILTCEIIERLAAILRPAPLIRVEGGASRNRPPFTALSRVPIQSEDHAIEVILQAFRRETLSNQTADSETRERPFRVSTLLALEPGLTGLTDDENRFRAMVDLGQECPGLDCGTWVVLCVGPGEEPSK